MKLRWTSHFARSYSKVPEDIQTEFGKQSLLLLQNLRHPSLRAKKYDEGKDRWQARVAKDWRFYFLIQDDTYILHDITHHPK
jgi:mRNA-degrading endonuclease RelE of RelBE toxin-antitoxin system